MPDIVEKAVELLVPSGVGLAGLWYKRRKYMDRGSGTGSLTLELQEETDALSKKIDEDTKRAQTNLVQYKLKRQENLG